MVWNRITNQPFQEQKQQQNAQLQAQIQSQQGEIQNMNANINEMAQGIQAIQVVVNQSLANQARNQGANVENAHGGQQPTDPSNRQVVAAAPVHNPPIVSEVPPVIVQNY